MNAKEVFEFLKPNKCNLILTIIVSVVLILILSRVVIPRMILEAPINLYFYLLLSMMVGIVVVSYTLISLIVYFVKGGHKDEK